MRALRTPSLVAALCSAAALAACLPAGGSLPEVRVHASVSPLAAEALAVLAQNRRVARVVLVADPAAAEVGWFGDPTEALAAAPLLVPGSAPPQPEVAARWRDARGRFFPLCARARVLLVNPHAGLPLAPRHLRDLAHPRLAGMQALVPFGREEGPLTAAALSLVFGEAATRQLLDAIARERPQLFANEAAVQAAVASGRAGFGLAGSEQGAAGAVSAAALEVVYPDEGGVGALVFPTAAGILVRGRGSEGARRLVQWMASADAEELMAARAPGCMPLRRGVPLPYGVRSAADVASPALDWEALAAARQKFLPLLSRWPEP